MVTIAEEWIARRELRKRIRTAMDEQGLDFQALAVRARCSVKLLGILLHNTDGRTHPHIALRILAVLGITDRSEARWLTARSRWEEIGESERPAGDWQTLNWEPIRQIAYRNHTSLQGLSIQMGKNSQYLNGHKTRGLRVATDDVMRLAELLGVKPMEIIKEDAG